MYRLNIAYKQFYITLNEIWLYESDPNAPIIVLHGRIFKWSKDVEQNWISDANFEGSEILASN